MDLKKSIEELLKETGRAGIEDLLTWMDENGFYESPCSGGNHLAKEGGLAEHSLNVYYLMSGFYHQVLRKTANIMQDSIVLCGLLHDLGKCGDYGKPGYVPNLLKGRTTKAKPEPTPYQSFSKPFKVNDALFPIDHEVRSIKIVSRFLVLTEEEELAILWHNGLYGNFRYQIQGKETPLYLLLHFADMWASRVVEKEEIHGDD